MSVFLRNSTIFATICTELNKVLEAYMCIVFLFVFSLQIVLFNMLNLNDDVGAWWKVFNKGMLFSA